jgi:iron complex outermembrane recepter protein
MFRYTLAAAAAMVLAAHTVNAQHTPDTAHTSSARADSARTAGALEGVIVRAVRASGSVPIAQTLVTRKAVERRSFAQDIPLLLQGASPSLTAHAESGSNWGYSYLRLRGMDQSRINLSLDGIPLNDPEDQVFYFANFADLASSVQSVQVQRGVGTSGAGSAAFAGSVNFETKPVFGQRRSSAAELQAGTFGARRVMLEGATGLVGGQFAAQVRVSALRSGSYRRHAGVQGLSGLAQIAWLGARDVVKATVLAGQLRDTLSYLAVPIDDLRRDRRINPLSPEEGDRFSQTMLSLSHTRQVSQVAQLATTLYRIAASGNYDVRFDSVTIANYNLDFGWYGVTSALNVDRGAVRLNVGVNANTYARDHFAYIKPTASSRLYFNTGHKQDASAFAKLSLTRGRATWFGDLQVRHSRFRYAPDSGAGFGADQPEISWTFVNPKLGVTVAVQPRTELFASIGRTTREPTRSDIFAGNDDLTRATLKDLGGIGRVRPERVTDTEVGFRWNGARVRVEANAFRMDFRNEIARIGSLSALGAELRSNVGASVRQGVELDLRVTPAAAISLMTLASVSYNRIARFLDSTVTPAVARANVPPLLSPALTATQRVDWRAHRWLDVGVEARYQGASFLRNDGNTALMLPSFTQVDAMVRVPFGANEVSVRGTNLGHSQRFGSGYAVSGVPNYFILPPRAVFVTVRVATR